MGAKNFSRFFKLTSARRMLGISADNRRKDQMYKIINWYMGPFLHIEPEKYNDKVIVKQFLFTTKDKKNTEVIINKYIGESDRSTMISNLVKIKTRNDLGINIIRILYEQGKNILFLTNRLSHVDIIYDSFAKEKCVGKYIGGMTKAALKLSSVKQIIVATFEMAQEGLDIDNLNVVILFSPKSDVKQAIGRILRKDEYEYNPIVIDIVDESNEIFAKQAKTRARYYADRKYHVQKFHVCDNKLDKHFMYNDLQTMTTALSKPMDIKPIEKIIKPIAVKQLELDFIDSDEE
jgi:superfamily II DNA or RNA helicase